MIYFGQDDGCSRHGESPGRRKADGEDAQRRSAEMGRRDEAKVRRGPGGVIAARLRVESLTTRP
jgi:hypothetical protein